MSLQRCRLLISAMLVVLPSSANFAWDANACSRAAPNDAFVGDFRNSWAYDLLQLAVTAQPGVVSSRELILEAGRLTASHTVNRCTVGLQTAPCLTDIAAASISALPSQTRLLSLHAHAGNSGHVWTMPCSVVMMAPGNHRVMLHALRTTFRHVSTLEVQVAWVPSWYAPAPLQWVSVQSWSFPACSDMEPASMRGTTLPSTGGCDGGWIQYEGSFHVQSAERRLWVRLVLTTVGETQLIVRDVLVSSVFTAAASPAVPYPSVRQLDMTTVHPAQHRRALNVQPILFLHNVTFSMSLTGLNVSSVFSDVGGPDSAMAPFLGQLAAACFSGVMDMYTAAGQQLQSSLVEVYPMRFYSIPAGDVWSTLPFFEWYYGIGPPPTMPSDSPSPTPSDAGMPSDSPSPSEEPSRRRRLTGSANLFPAPPGGVDSWTGLQMDMVIGVIHPMDVSFIGGRLQPDNPANQREVFRSAVVGSLSTVNSPLLIPGWGVSFGVPTYTVLPYNVSTSGPSTGGGSPPPTFMPMTPVMNRHNVTFTMNLTGFDVMRALSNPDVMEMVTATAVVSGINSGLTARGIMLSSFPYQPYEVALRRVHSLPMDPAGGEHIMLYSNPSYAWEVPWLMNSPPPSVSPVPSWVRTPSATATATASFVSSRLRQLQGGFFPFNVSSWAGLRLEMIFLARTQGHAHTVGRLLDPAVADNARGTVAGGIVSVYRAFNESIFPAAMSAVLSSPVYPPEPPAPPMPSPFPLTVNVPNITITVDITGFLIWDAIAFPGTTSIFNLFPEAVWAGMLDAYALGGQYSLPSAAVSVTSVRIRRMFNIPMPNISNVPTMMFYCDSTLVVEGCVFPPGGFGLQPGLPPSSNGTATAPSPTATATVGTTPTGRRRELQGQNPGVTLYVGQWSGIRCEMTILFSNHAEAFSAGAMLDANNPSNRRPTVRSGIYSFLVAHNSTIYPSQTLQVNLGTPQYTTLAASPGGSSPSYTPWMPIPIMGRFNLTLPVNVTGINVLQIFMNGQATVPLFARSVTAAVHAILSRSGRLITDPDGFATSVFRNESVDIQLIWTIPRPGPEAPVLIFLSPGYYWAYPELANAPIAMPLDFQGPPQQGGHSSAQPTTTVQPTGQATSATVTARRRALQGTPVASPTYVYFNVSSLSGLRLQVIMYFNNSIDVSTVGRLLDASIIPNERATFVNATRAELTRLDGVIFPASTAVEIGAPSYTDSAPPPSALPSVSATGTSSAAVSRVPTGTASSSGTATASGSATASSAATNTATASGSVAASGAATSTATASGSAAASRAATSTATASGSSVGTASTTPTLTATPTSTPTSTGTPTPSQTPTPSPSGPALPKLPPPSIRHVLPSLDLATVVTVASRSSIGANGQEAISGMGGFPLALPDNEAEAAHWIEYFESAAERAANATGSMLYASMGGRRWTDLSAAYALSEWLRLPYRPANVSVPSLPGLPLLNLAWQWSTLSPNATLATAARALLTALQPTSASSTEQQFLAYTSSATSSNYNSLSPVSNSTGLQAYTSGLLVTRAQLHEPLVLLADVWALPVGWVHDSAIGVPPDTSRLPPRAYPGFVKGSSATPSLGGPRAAQRAIVTAPNTLFIPDGSSDSRAPGLTAGNCSVDTLTATNPYSSILSTPGVVVSVRRVTWTLSGVPSPALLSRYVAAGVSPLHGLSLDAGGKPTGQQPHSVTLTSGGMSAVVPPGRLLAGYVYSATASLEGFASLVFGPPVKGLFRSIPFNASQPGRMLQGQTPVGADSGTAWSDPVTGERYMLTLPPVLGASSAATSLLQGTGHGLGGQAYTVGAETLPVLATPIRAANVYMHTPPLFGTLSTDPVNGTALLTRFNVSTMGWALQPRSRARSAVPLQAALVAHLMQAPLPTSWIDAWLSISSAPGSIGSRVTSLLSAASSAAGTGLCAGGRATLLSPAWWARQAAIGTALGQGVDLVCANVEVSTRSALNRLVTSNSLVLPLNWRRTPSTGAAALSLPSALVGTEAFTYSFRVDSSGAQANASDPLSAIGLYSARAADLALSPNTWDGTPLASPSAATRINTALPIPDTGDAAVLYVFVRDEEGAVGFAFTSVNVFFTIPTGDAASGSLTAATATGAFVSEVANTLTKDTVAANPFNALLIAGSLSTVLTNASSSTLRDSLIPGGNRTILNVTAQQVEDLRRNNTALKESLVTTVNVAVTSIAESSTGRVGSSLGSLLGNATITISLSSGVGPAAGGQADSSPLNVSVPKNLTSEALQALQSDTSIAIEDSIAVAASAALVELTSDPSELSATAKTLALGSLQTVLAFSLPTNVLLGVSDDGNDISSNGGDSVGGSINGTGPVRTVSPADPVFLSAGASITLNVLTASAIGNSTDATGSGTSNITSSQDAQQALRRQAQSTLTLLASTMARDVFPGDPAKSVAAGPSKAFRAAVARARRLQGGAESLPESFCEQALTLTTSRVSMANVSADTVYEVEVEDPINPCLSNPAAARAARIAAQGGAVAGVSMSQTFIASGATSRVVDIQIVQASSTFGLSESDGFSTFVYERGASRINTARTLSDVAYARQLATGGTSLDAIQRLGVSSSSATSVRDLQPGSGLDTRPLTVNLRTRSGRTIGVEDAPEPVYITIPLRDFSLPGGSKAGALSESNKPQSFTFTCPLEREGDTLKAGDVIPVSLSNASSTPSSNLTMPVVSIQRVTYVTNGEDLPRLPTSCKLPFTTCDDTGKPTTSYTITSAAQQASEAASNTVNRALRNVTRPVFVMQVPCAGPPGPRNVTCGPGAYGNRTTFTCPAIQPQAVCAYWDESTSRWFSEGCSVYNVTDDAIVCACTHLTEFAGRFAALAADNRDIFAQVGKLDQADYDRAILMLTIVGSIVGVLLFSIILAVSADRYGDRRFYATLLADEEIQFMRRISELRGRTFILDRKLDAEKAATAEKQRKVGMKSAKVGLESAEKSLKLIAGAEESLSTEAALAAARATVSRGRVPTDSQQALLARAEVMRRRVAEAKCDEEAVGPPRLITSSAMEAGRGQDGARQHLSVAAELAAEDIVNVRGKDSAHVDPYSAALYVRLMEQFEPYRVTPDNLAGISYGPKAAAVLSKVVDSGLAKELMDEADDPTNSRTTTEASGAFESARARPGTHAYNSLTEQKATQQKPAGVLTKAGSNFGGTFRRLVEAAASQSESHKLSVMSKAGDKMRLFNDATSWSCTRAWRIKTFIARVWLLRLWFTHVYLSIFTRYDPRSPRAGRLLLLATSLIGNMFVTAFFYAFRNGRPGEDMPPMEVSETIVVALLASFLQMPVEIVTRMLVDWAGAAEFTHRYPFLWSELNRRRESEKKLAAMSKQALAAELAMAGKDEKGDVLAVVSSLTARAAAQGTRPPQGGTSSYLRKAAADGLISVHAADSVAGASSGSAASSPEARSSEDDDDDPYEYGWIDAPPGCVHWCPCLLWACKRHPKQKAAFIAKHVAEETAKLNARRKKVTRFQGKRGAALPAPVSGGPIEDATDASAGPGASTAQQRTAARTGVAVLGTTGVATAIQSGLEGSVFRGGTGVASGPATVEEGAPEDEGTNDDADEGGGGDVQADIEGLLTAEDVGDYAVVVCTTLCACCAAMAARRGSKKAKKEVAAQLKRSASGRSMAAALRSNSGRQLQVEDTTTVIGSDGQPVVAVVQRQNSARRRYEEEEAEEERHAQAIASTSAGYLRAACCCTCCPCTSATMLAYLICAVWLAFCLFYLLLFGLYQPAQVTTDFCIAFAVSQAITLFLVQPGLLLFSMLLQLAVIPAWIPYLIWVPAIGPRVAGKVAATVQGGGSSALTGRLENLTLVRAAGAASMLAPESAIIAFGATAVLGAAMGGAGKLVQRATEARRKRGVAAREADASAPGSGASALSLLTEAERHELIVRRYLVAQLKQAEVAYRKRTAKERAMASLHKATAVIQALKTASAVGTEVSAATVRDATEVHVPQDEETVTVPTHPDPAPVAEDVPVPAVGPSDPPEAPAPGVQTLTQVLEDILPEHPAPDYTRGLRPQGPVVAVTVSAEDKEVNSVVDELLASADRQRTDAIARSQPAAAQPQTDSDAEMGIDDIINMQATPTRQPPSPKRKPVVPALGSPATLAALQGASASAGTGSPPDAAPSPPLPVGAAWLRAANAHAASNSSPASARSDGGQGSTRRQVPSTSPSKRNNGFVWENGSLVVRSARDK